jgi:two-component system cell cycle response regulator DivK
MSSPDELTKRAQRVLIVDDDRDILTVVTEALGDEGYEVHTLSDNHAPPVLDAVRQLEPDCVLLDSQSHDGYGASWELASQLARLPRPVPVVMFTAHQRDTNEACANTSARSRAARFAGILAKPFELDYLIDVVTRASRSDHRSNGTH